MRLPSVPCVLVLVSCAGDLPSVRVPDRVAESLPRQSRLLLRDAEQEVVIVQADDEDAAQEVRRRRADLARAEAKTGGDAARELREAEIALARARLSVAEGEVELAALRLDLARLRRDQTHAEVLLRHELISASAAQLAERRARLAAIGAGIDESIAQGRKLRDELDRLARKRDVLLDRHLSQTAGKAGTPWIE